MLDGGLCMECLSSQYYDSTTCKTCHDSCRSCFGPGQFACKACAPPLHLDQLNSQCVSCCPNQTVDNAAENSSSSSSSSVPAPCCPCDGETGECKATSTGGKRRTVVGAYKSGGGYSTDAARSLGSEGNGNEFVLRLDSPLTAITAIAVAICLLIITIFSIIFAVLQRNSNHVTRNSVRYRKIASKKRKRISEARLIFNNRGRKEEEDEDEDNDNNTEEEEDDNSEEDRVYKKGTIHGNEFYIESTNDIDAIEFHCAGAAARAPAARRSKGMHDINPNAKTEHGNSPTTSRS